MRVRRVGFKSEEYNACRVPTPLPRPAMTAPGYRDHGNGSPGNGFLPCREKKNKRNKTKRENNREKTRPSHLNG